MDATQDHAELAAAFRKETDALVEFDRRIDRLMRERRRLEMAFDAIAATIDAALDRGEAPLALIDELQRIDQRSIRLERDLTANLIGAEKNFRPGPKL